MRTEFGSARHLIFGAAIAVVVAGCAAGTQIQASDVKSIQVGKTTASQVASMFGQPMTRNVDPSGGENWTYAYASGGYFRLLGSGTSQALIVVFNKGIVTNCYFTAGQQSIGGMPTTATMPCDRL